MSGCGEGVGTARNRCECVFLDLNPADKADERNEYQSQYAQPVVQYNAYSGEHDDESKITWIAHEAVRPGGVTAQCAGRPPSKRDPAPHNYESCAKRGDASGNGCFLNFRG